MDKSKIGTTLTHYVLDEQRGHVARTGQSTTGEFSSLLTQIAVAGKIISAEVNMAGLADALGVAGRTNVQGEEQMKLDVFANQAMVEILGRCGHVCLMASEEVEDAIPVPKRYPCGKYVVAFDPLDGSSNIDVNVSIGSIFAIYRRRSPEGRPGELRDLLQPGRNLVAAGYVLYGSSTMLVYSAGLGVHGFTLDPMLGEFLLSHERIRIPEACGTYSVNEANTARWSAGTRKFIEEIKDPEESPLGALSARYIGSLVADFHRNLLKGGIFLYPADSKSPQGKLRLLYEAAPLAYLARDAGGHASTGTEAILDIEPSDLHQRVPLIIGNRDAVELYEKYLASEAR